MRPKAEINHSRVVNLWAGLYGPARPRWNLGPVMLNFISISIFKRFFNKNLNFIITHLKLSIVLSKKWRILAKSSRNSRKKRPGPARRNFGPERPGPARICQAWDLQPWTIAPIFSRKIKRSILNNRIKINPAESQKIVNIFWRFFFW